MSVEDAFDGLQDGHDARRPEPAYPWRLLTWTQRGNLPMQVRGDSRADRSPQGTASYSCDLRKTPLRWTSQEPTKVATAAQIAAPQGTASYSCDLRKTPLRSTSQEPTKVATVAQIAAPQGTASYSCDLRKTPLRWTSQEPTTVATLAQIAATQGAARGR